MLCRLLVLSLFAALGSTGSSKRCKWMHEGFRKRSEKSLELIESLANNSIDTSGVNNDNETVPFPGELYQQATSASAVEKLDFVVQVLEEVDVLFKENYSSTKWDKNTVEHFREVTYGQRQGLGKCIRFYNKRNVNIPLRVYFKNLSSHILERNGHSAEAWELSRKEIEMHLLRIDLLISRLLSAEN